MIVCGDFNGHIGCERKILDHVIDVGDKNADGERVTRSYKEMKHSNRSYDPVEGVP